MVSKVYFADVRAISRQESLPRKVERRTRRRFFRVAVRLRHKGNTFSS